MSEYTKRPKIPQKPNYTSKKYQDSDDENDRIHNSPAIQTKRLPALPVKELAVPKPKKDQSGSITEMIATKFKAPKIPKKSSRDCEYKNLLSDSTMDAHGDDGDDDDDEDYAIFDKFDDDQDSIYEATSGIYPDDVRPLNYGSNRWKCSLFDFLKNPLLDYLMIMVVYSAFGVGLTCLSENRDSYLIRFHLTIVSTLLFVSLSLLIDKGLNLSRKIILLYNLNILIIIFSMSSFVCLITGVTTSSYYYHTDRIAVAAGGLLILNGVILFIALWIFIKVRIWKRVKHIREFPL